MTANCTFVDTNVGEMTPYLIASLIKWQCALFSHERRDSEQYGGSIDYHRTYAYPICGQHPNLVAVASTTSTHKSTLPSIDILLPQMSERQYFVSYFSRTPEKNQVIRTTQSTNDGSKDNFPNLSHTIPLVAMHYQNIEEYTLSWTLFQISYYSQLMLLPNAPLLVLA